jgi:photosystem II stability/assembly factor-like uncharacterized protein
LITCLSCNGKTTTAGDEPATVLLVATIAGVHRFEREAPGARWSLRERTLEDLHVSSLLWEPSAGLLLAGAHGDGGLWASLDRGCSWEPRVQGLHSRHVYTLAAQRRGDDTVLFAGTEPPALYRSDDLGLSWHELAALQDVPGTEEWTFPPPPHIAHVKNVSFHASEPETLYVCIEQGALLKSVDDGRSWFEESGYDSSADMFRHDNHRVVIEASDPTRLFMCGGEGLYHSADAGRTWTHLTGRDHRVGYPDAMFIDPRDDDVLYMAGPRFPPRRWGETRAADPTVLRSRDGGRSWNEIRDGLPEHIVGNIEAMGMHASTDRVMLVAGTATGEVFACDDAGAPWQLVADGLPPISKGGHYRWFLSAEQREAVEARMSRGT